jgi:glucose-1-phosphate thymidylyltransferase
VRVKAAIVVGRGSWAHGRARGASSIPALEPVANKPIIHHVLDGFRAASISDLIVVGESDTVVAVRACLDGYGQGFEQIDYVESERSPDVGATLRSIAPAVGDSPCLLQPADGLFGEPVASLVPSLEQGAADMILPVADLTDALSNGDEVHFHSHRNGSTAPDDPNAALAVFGPGALRRASEVARPSEQADLAVIAERVAATGATVRFQLVESWRRYNGRGADLLELNRVALEGLLTDVCPSVRSENRIEGRVSIHPTASVHTSVIVGPTVIGEGAMVDNAYIGPYTSIGAGARIEGAEIERSIISPGASVLYVGGRLVSSLVGRNARVFRDFSLPRAMRLWVGDDDEVALC